MECQGGDYARGGHLRGVGVGNIHVGGTRTLHEGGTYGVSGRGLCTGGI